MHDLPPFPGLRPHVFDFLRQPARNNRREWFKPRKELYEVVRRRAVPDEALPSPDFTEAVVQMAHDVLPLLEYGWHVEAEPSPKRLCAHEKRIAGYSFIILLEVSLPVIPDLIRDLADLQDRETPARGPG